MDSVKSFQRKAKILKKTSHQNLSYLFNEIDALQILKSAHEIFEIFLKKSKSIILNFLNNLAPEIIFNSYFDKRPPFQDGKEEVRIPRCFYTPGINAIFKWTRSIHIIK